MPPPTRSSATRPPPRPEPARAPLSPTAKWVGWGVYGGIVLMGFVFGVVAGNQRPKVIEVVKVAPAPDKPDAKIVPPVEPPPAKKETPATPPPKKEPVEPVGMETKTPEPKPEPKPEVKPPTVAQVSFVKEVLPIFKAKCMLCHGDTKGVKGGLDLRTLAAITKGGDSGTAVTAGDPLKGSLWQSIEDMMMPPAGKEQLTEAEKKVIKNWIEAGAK